jgi:hypothetical protein
MLKNVLENISGIEIYPLISLIIFFIFFIFMMIWLFRVDKSYYEKMSNVPLEGSNNKNTDNAGGLK